MPARRSAASLPKSATQKTLLAGLAERFGLAEPPQRIEVYDNSHIMGTNAVGAMIVAGPEGFVKGQYRKFNIRSDDLTPGDDYGMMREVLGRRFARLIRENGPREGAARGSGADGPVARPRAHRRRPGQLAAAGEVLAELGIQPTCRSSASPRGRTATPAARPSIVAGREPFMLQPRDPVLYFVQRLRDEAHRFAIGSHRARRKADIARNPLDEIAGIGPTRKRALLRHFGTAKAVSRANIADLTAVDGISEQMARTDLRPLPPDGGIAASRRGRAA